MIEPFAEAGKLGAFVLTTLWVHGPWSPLFPAAYEPVLLMFGKLYSPLLVAAVGAPVSVLVEWVNYRVYNWMSGLQRLESLKRKAVAGRLVKLFEKQPFLVVWIFAWSPAPDWAARVLAVLSGYSIRRYLLAFLLGRLPKFWVLAYVGRELPVSERTLIIAAVSVVMLSYGIAVWRARRTAPVS